MSGGWETGPARVTSGPAGYPPPGPGPLTTWRLRTPSDEPVGALAFDAAGARWTPAAGASANAAAHAAEVSDVLRSLHAEGVALTAALALVRDAYAGDLFEE